MALNSRDTDHIELLVRQFVQRQQQEVAAHERGDLRGANRAFDELNAALRALAGTASGRAALEGLANHEMPEVRLRAAGQMMRWSPEKAIPTLGRLVSTWRPKDPRKGYVAVATEAAGWLFEHFGVKDFDRDNLIGPLREYGLDLRRRAE